MRPKWQKLIWMAPAVLLGMVLFTFIGGEIVLHLWNWLLPPLFGWRELTFWQALGMLALCRILFGGFGMNGSGRSPSRRGISRRTTERLDEGGEHLTPEERERLRQSMHGRYGFDPATGESPGQ